MAIFSTGFEKGVLFCSCAISDRNHDRHIFVVWSSSCRRLGIRGTKRGNKGRDFFSEQAIQVGELVGINRLLTPDQQARIAAAFVQTGFGNLTGAKELLGDLCDYAQLRLFRTLHGKKG